MLLRYDAEISKWPSRTVTQLFFQPDCTSLISTNIFFRKDGDFQGIQYSVSNNLMSHPLLIIVALIA